MKTRPLTRSRRGTFIPILAVCTVALFAFIALAVDLGVLAVVRTECQNAVDSAALTGARLLNNKPTATYNNFTTAKTGAENTITANRYLAQNFIAAERTVTIGRYAYDSGASKFIADPASFTATAGMAPAGSWTAVRTSVSVTQATYFAKVQGLGVPGITQVSNGAYAIAVHRPRDIAIVLDYTGSMGNDSYPYFGDADGRRCLNNPDPQYPKFGHYARYMHYDTSNATTTNDANPSNRANPLRRTSTYAGDRNPPSNYTADSAAGPPMCADYLTAPGDPATVTTATSVDYPFQWWATAAAGTPSSSPPINTRANTLLTPPTPTLYNWGAYAANQMAKPIPAPPNYENQDDAAGFPAYLGDKWPRTTGARGPDTSSVPAAYPSQMTDSLTYDSWTTRVGNNFTDKAAKTVTEYLGGLYALTGGAGRNLATWTFPNTGPDVASYGDPAVKFTNVGATQPVDGGQNAGEYRDAVWENYGYDIDMVALRAQAGPARTVTLVPAADRFKGYAMGPGYWGMTFFIWPPDPRWGNPSGGAPLGGAILPHSPSTTDPRKDTNGNWICDWRKRFFLRGDSTSAADVLFTNSDNINFILFNNNTNQTDPAAANTQVSGQVFNNPVNAVGANGASNTRGYYTINYRAIIAWLKSPMTPKVLPTNLRAGRIKYYGSMPDDLRTTAGGDADDKTFLRNYIHWVLGIREFNNAYAAANGSYATPTGVGSVENRNPFGTISVSTTAPTQFDPNGAAAPAAQPRAYMNYGDNINRPRMQFWFGPYTLTTMFNPGGQSGVVSPALREGARWQLGAAVNSVLDDIRNNHPNDYCGITGYSTRNYTYSDYDIPMAPMSQDWFTLKNSLFFRRQVVATLKANAADPIENRVFDGSFNPDYNKIWSLPVAQGGTDPQTGMAVAYNLLSSADTATLPITRTSDGVAVLAYGNPANGYRGRRGTNKIIVFETDGEPNQNPTWGLSPSTGGGANTKYIAGGGTDEVWPEDSANINAAGRRAIAIVKRIVALTTADPPGFSLSNSPARVYSIGFGAIFDGWPTHGSMSGAGQNAHRFLLRVQQMGNTSSKGATPAVESSWPSPPGALLPTDQVIVGPYQRPDPSQPISGTNPAGRIEKLRTCLQRIFQSGVQVTLIE